LASHVVVRVGAVGALRIIGGRCFFHRHCVWLA
jgi:hypothetical protein